MVKYLPRGAIWAKGHSARHAPCPTAARHVAGHEIGLAWWTNTASHVIDHGGDTAGYHALVAMTADHSKGVVFSSSGPAITDVDTCSTQAIPSCRRRKSRQYPRSSSISMPGPTRTRRLG